MFLVKSLIICKRLIDGVVAIIIKPIFFVFKLLLTKPLIKLYHLIFKFKKSDLAESPWHEIIRKKSLHVSVFTLTVFVAIFNIYNHNSTSNSTSNANKTVISHLIRNEFSVMNDSSSLIEEKVNLQQIMAAGKEKYRDMNLAIFNRSAISETENEDDDLAFYSNGAIKNNRPFIEIKTGSAESGVDSANSNATRNSIIYYTVNNGDTISSIARKFGLSVNTVLWSNNLNAFSLIRPGNSLAIMPVNGVSYTVKSGDTLGKIASMHGVDSDSIFKYNSLRSVNSLKIGQTIVIPGGKKLAAPTPIITKVATKSVNAVAVIEKLVTPKKAIESGSSMLWPTEGHRITQYYSWRHTGLDIANKVGTPLYAADSGTVIFSGWSNGYGNNVMIDHGNGKKTRYAHASKLFVRVGDKVSRGEQVAAMGSTGNSTGPHIHFEVIVNNVKQNPLNYIK